MRIELESVLCDRYPNLYRCKSAEIPTTAMVWGFEHGDGWFGIIDSLSIVLADLDPDVQVKQVKEKFGTLRFYIDTGSKAAGAAICAADAFSARICETTGRPGVLFAEGGWFSTMSPEAWSTRSPKPQEIASSDQEENDEYGWASRFPKFDKKQVFLKDDAIGALKKRHPEALAGTRKIDFPSRLFDLMDVAIQEISGRQQRKPGTSVVKISEIFWNCVDGLVILPSFASMRAVALERIDSDKEQALKFNNVFVEPALTEVLHQIADEAAAVALFAKEMAKRMDVHTGRCGPVDDRGRIIDPTQTGGDMENTRDVFATVGLFEHDNIFEPTVYCRKEIKATLEAHESIAELMRKRTVMPLLPRIYWQHDLLTLKGIRPTPLRVAKALAREHIWRVALPVEISRFFMGRCSKPDVRKIDTFLYDQDIVRDYEKVGLKFKPVPDMRLLEFNPAGQVIWHHIHYETGISRKALIEDARYAAAAWFNDPLFRGWLVADMRENRFEGLELFLAQAIMNAFEEEIGIAREAPADFNPSEHEAEATRIFGWQLVEGRGRFFLRAHRIENHAHISDGDSLDRSTPLVWIDEKLGWARTRSRYYRLMGECLR